MEKEVKPQTICIMNKGHERYFRMFGNVQSVMDTNTTTWSTIPIVSGFKNELDEVIQRIDSIYFDNYDDSKAITRKKDRLREKLIIKIPILTSALYVLGDLTDDEKLKEYKSYTKSALKNMKEIAMVAVVTSIIKAARSREELQSGFGISEAQITEMETTLDDFKHLIGEARNVRNTVYANINELETLIDAGNQLLRNKVDKVMKVFELSNPGFYDLYTRARSIVN